MKEKFIPILSLFPYKQGDNPNDHAATAASQREYQPAATAATYWLWNILGSLIIVGPFIYTYKLLHAMNDLCADYNARG